MILHFRILLNYKLNTRKEDPVNFTLNRIMMLLHLQLMDISSGNFEI